MDSKTTKIVAVVVVLCLVAVAVGAFVINNNNSNPSPQPEPIVDKNWVSINNYSKYQYLAVGTEKATSNDVSNLYFKSKTGELSAQPGDNVKLYGIDSNGNCVKLQFTNKDGKVVEQDANLIHYDKYKNISTAIFSTESAEYVDSAWNMNVEMRYYDFTNYGYNQYVGYKIAGKFNSIIDSNIRGEPMIIDDRTGNIYSVKNICDKIGVKSISLYTPSLNHDKMFFFANHDNYKCSMYSLIFNEKDIVVEEVMNKDQFDNFTYSTFHQQHDNNLNHKIKIDKFGNLVSSENGYPDYSLSPDSIIRKVDGNYSVLKAIDPNYNPSYSYEYVVGFNGYYYLWAFEGNNVVYSSYVDENGVFQKTDQVLSDISGHLVDSYNDRYYLTIMGKQSTTITNYSAVLKEVIIDQKYAWKYSIVEKTILSDESNDKVKSFVEKAVGMEDNIYSYYGKTLWQYKISSGELKVISFDKTVNDLFYDSKVKVVKAVVVDPSSIQSVIGYIDPDKGLILEDYIIEKDNKRIYIIDPINV